MATRDEIEAALSVEQGKVWSACNVVPEYVGDVKRAIDATSRLWTWALWHGRAPGVGPVAFLVRPHPVRPGGLVVLLQTGTAAEAVIAALRRQQLNG